MIKSIVVKCIIVIFLFSIFIGCKTVKPKPNEVNENQKTTKSNNSDKINAPQLDAEKNKSDYTKESWKDYQDALKKALLMPEDTADEVKKKSKAIDDALKKLIKITNKDSLEFQKNTANEIKKEKSSFTAESWNDFQKALEIALSMPETTDEEIKAKKEAIENAIKKLVRNNNDNKKNLDSEKKSAKDIAKYKVIYTPESWDEYQKALKEALLMPENTDEEIKAKTKALQDALKKLIKQKTKDALNDDKESTKDVAKDKSSFTTESWDEYQKALQEALLMPETTDEEIKAKTEAIKDALKKLVKETTKQKLNDEKKLTKDVAKDKSSFTTESWNEYQKALKEALLMPETTEEEIKAKTEAIKDALKKLVKETTKQKLNDEKKLTEDAEKEKSSFTTESWDEYQKALKEALLMPENTEEEIIAKAEALKNALKKLVKKNNDIKKNLDSEINSAKDIEKQKVTYTPESWDDYQKALQKALSMPETTDEEMKAKAEAIKDAMKKLVKQNQKNILDSQKNAIKETAKERSSFTTESWDDYQKALQEALLMPETTDEEMKAKTAAIQDALKKLVKSGNKNKETNPSFIPKTSGFTGEIDTSTGSLTVTYFADKNQILGSVPVDNYYYPIKGTVVVRNNIGNLAGEEIRDGIRQRFIKWNSKPDGTGTDFLPGYSFQILENTKFYAVFTTGNDVLRKVGVGGGWVFYDAGSKQSWGRYLEAANEDMTSSPWGKSHLLVKGADETAIGSGMQNTIDIINSDAAEINKAADLCYSYKSTFCGKTYNDWFLPSKDELNMLYINMGRGKDEHNVVYTIPPGIKDGYYWSSSESDKQLAWLHYFKFGKQHAYFKQSDQGVRPIRYF